jgi:hypothetical protein
MRLFFFLSLQNEFAEKEADIILFYTFGTLYLKNQSYLKIALNQN